MDEELNNIDNALEESRGSRNPFPEEGEWYGYLEPEDVL